MRLAETGARQHQEFADVAGPAVTPQRQRSDPQRLSVLPGEGLSAAGRVRRCRRSR